MQSNNVKPQEYEQDGDEEVINSDSVTSGFGDCSAV